MKSEKGREVQINADFKLRIVGIVVFVRSSYSFKNDERRNEKKEGSIDRNLKFDDVSHLSLYLVYNLSEHCAPPIPKRGETLKILSCGSRILLQRMLNVYGTVRTS